MTSFPTYRRTHSDQIPHGHMPSQQVPLPLSPQDSQQVPFFDLASEPVQSAARQALPQRDIRPQTPSSEQAALNVGLARLGAHSVNSFGSDAPDR